MTNVGATSMDAMIANGTTVDTMFTNVTIAGLLTTDATITGATVTAEFTPSVYNESSNITAFATAVHAESNIAPIETNGMSNEYGSVPCQPIDYSVRSVNFYENCTAATISSGPLDLSMGGVRDEIPFVPSMSVDSDDFDTFFYNALVSGAYSYDVLLNVVRCRLARISSYYADILGVELIDQLSRIILDQCLRGDFTDMYAMLRSR